MQGHAIIFCALILAIYIAGILAAEELKKPVIAPVEPSKSPSTPSPTKTVNVTSSLPPATPSNCSDSGNVTCSPPHQGILGMVSDAFMENKGMLQRTFYVLLGVTTLVVIYFVVKTVRLRRRQSKSKKYGVISTQQDTLEMIPLDQDDEDDDMTVFEVNGRR